MITREDLDLLLDGFGDEMVGAKETVPQLVVESEVVGDAPA